MAQIKSGTVRVTSGSSYVYGSSNVQWTTLFAGSLFTVEEHDPSYQVASITANPPAVSVTAVPADSQLVYSAAHGITSGREVVLKGTAAPAGLGLEVQYFAYAFAADKITLHTTYANALTGANPVLFTTAGTSVAVAETPWLTLTAPYGGDSVITKKYAITNYFTPHFSLPLLSQGDLNSPTVINRAMTIIDEYLSYAVIAGHPLIVSTDYTILPDDLTVLVSGAATITLPVASSRLRTVTVINLSNFPVIVAARGGDLIEGNQAITLQPYEGRTFNSVSNTYYIIGGIFSLDAQIARTGRIAEAWTALNIVLASSVSAATSYGLSSSVGVSTEFARADHTHGTPSLAAHGVASSLLPPKSDDPRLSDARTPLAHASSHLSAGSDPIALATPSTAGLMSAADKTKLNAALTVPYSHPTSDGYHHVPPTASQTRKFLVCSNLTAESESWGAILWSDIGSLPSSFAPTIGAGANEAVAGNDPRLTDSRNPLSHVLATGTALGGDHTISGASVGSVLRASSSTSANFQRLVWIDIDSKPATFAPIIGSSANEAVAGNDPRLTNARTPASHVLATSAGLGSEHTVADLTSGNVLKATSPTTAAFSALLWEEVANKPLTFAPIIGAGATEAVAGDDSRLTDARSATGTPLSAGSLWLGNSSDLATVTAISGDITLDSAGVATIGLNRVGLTKIAAGLAGSILVYSASGQATALPPSNTVGSLLISNGTGNVPVWGDASIIPTQTSIEISYLALEYNSYTLTGYNQQVVAFNGYSAAPSCIFTEGSSTEFSLVPNIPNYAGIRIKFTEEVNPELPVGLSYDTYYFLSGTASAAKLHLTRADALAAINPVSFTPISLTCYFVKTVKIIAANSSMKQVVLVFCNCEWEILANSGISFYSGGQNIPAATHRLRSLGENTSITLRYVSGASLLQVVSVTGTQEIVGINE